MEPMDITVSTSVVVTVYMILHVTNRLVTVTRDVARDLLQTVTAAKVNIKSTWPKNNIESII